MEKLITNYALDDIGVTTLRMLANILKIKDARTADAPFNLLLTYNDEHEANRFVTDLEQYISASSGGETLVLFSYLQIAITLWSKEKHSVHSLKRYLNVSSVCASLTMNVNVH